MGCFFPYSIESTKLQHMYKLMTAYCDTKRRQIPAVSLDAWQNSKTQSMNDLIDLSMPREKWITTRISAQVMCVGGGRGAAFSLVKEERKNPTQAARLLNRHSQPRGSPHTTKVAKPVRKPAPSKRGNPPPRGTPHPQPLRWPPESFPRRPAVAGRASPAVSSAMEALRRVTATLIKEGRRRELLLSLTTFHHVCAEEMVVVVAPWSRRRRFKV